MRLKKLHNEMFRDLHYPANNVRAITSNRMWHAWGRKNSRSGLIGNSEGKRPLVRPRYWWDDNIRWMLEKYDTKRWHGSTWVRIWTSSIPRLENISFLRRTILCGIISTAICTYYIITTNRPLVCATN